MITKDYIRGFFDGEGSISFKYPRRCHFPQLEFCNTCLPIMLEIKDYLETEGYRFRFVTEPRQNKSRHKTLYRIVMTRWKSILKWIDEIGSEHPDKLARFEQAKALYRQRRSYRVPLSGKASTVKAVEQMLKHSNPLIPPES